MSKTLDKSLTLKIKVLYFSLTFVLVIIVSLILSEIILRTYTPLEYAYPKWRYSPEYGIMLHTDVKMIHSKPGAWKFIYTINKYGYRGTPVPISESYDKKNIIVLGDSGSFGHGVSDGFEYPAVLGKELGSRYNVINLAVGGWGLTQEIRRYYEFGILYKPNIVIIQFCGNDPMDNLKHKVTTLDGSNFVFHNVPGRFVWLKLYLSKSRIQMSQTYNFIIRRVIPYFSEMMAQKPEDSKMELKQYGIPLEETFYITLLDAFARKLNESGIKLIFIAVNRQLEGYPHIKLKVMELNASGMLTYYEVADWLANESNYHAPDGHVWGAKAHAIIGHKLGEAIKIQF